jgi:hypothetical protein
MALGSVYINSSNPPCAEIKNNWRSNTITSVSLHSVALNSVNLTLHLSSCDRFYVAGWRGSNDT